MQTNTNANLVRRCQLEKANMECIYCVDYISYFVIYWWFSTSRYEYNKFVCYIYTFKIKTAVLFIFFLPEPLTSPTWTLTVNLGLCEGPATSISLLTNNGSQFATGLFFSSCWMVSISWLAWNSDRIKINFTGLSHRWSSLTFLSNYPTIIKWLPIIILICSLSNNRAKQSTLDPKCF